MGAKGTLFDRFGFVLKVGATGIDPWDELWALGEEIDREWRTGKSAVEILSEMRR